MTVNNKQRRTAKAVLRKTAKKEQLKPVSLSLNLFSQYHSTVIKALGEDAKKINAKIGSIMADRWIDSTGKFNNNIEFAQSLEDYLKELEFANYVNINCDEKNYVIDIKGCAICHGNEILRKEGIATPPIIQTAKYAAAKKIGRNIITKGVDKPGIGRMYNYVYIIFFIF